MSQKMPFNKKKSKSAHFEAQSITKTNPFLCEYGHVTVNFEFVNLQ